MRRDARGFIERVEAAREQRGLGRYEFSEAIGQAGSYWSAWVSRHQQRETFPRGDTVAAMADTLGVSMDYLFGATDEAVAAAYKSYRSSDAVLLAAIGAEPLPHDEALSIDEFTGSARTGQRNQVPQGFDEQLPRKRKATGFSGLVRLRVSGSCMVPRLNPGDLVIFDTRRAPEPGQIVLAVLDEHEALIKRLAVRDGQRWLVALDGWEQVVDERVRIVGVAVMVQAALV